MCLSRHYSVSVREDGNKVCVGGGGGGGGVGVSGFPRLVLTTSTNMDKDMFTFLAAYICMMSRYVGD